MADFGTDISTFPDLDPRFRLISGPQVVVEALARRLTTSRGSLISDPAYGWDVRQLLNAERDRRSDARAIASMKAQVEADERVLSARVTMTPAGDALSITVRFTTQAGPFAFVLSVGAARVALRAASETS
jgi:hypothetical protein